MAWIESHQDLADHPKTKRLRRALGISLPTAIGHLHLLWWWALSYADDGDLAECTDEDIAEAARWEGDATAFVDALTATGFLDADRLIHDWATYAGRLIERRRADAERKRRDRGQNPPSAACPPDVPRMSNGQRAPSGVTVPNRTSTGPDPRPETKDEVPPTAVGGPTATAAAPSPTETNGAIPKPNRIARVLDALTAFGVTVQPTGREAKAIRDSRAPPEEIAAAYAAVVRGDWGDDWFRENLSLHLVIDRLAGYRTSQQVRAAAPRDRHGVPRDPHDYARGRDAAFKRIGSS